MPCESYLANYVVIAIMMRTPVGYCAYNSIVSRSAMTTYNTLEGTILYSRSVGTVHTYIVPRSLLCEL